jgi:hypothetical protein
MLSLEPSQEILEIFLNLSKYDLFKNEFIFDLFQFFTLTNEIDIISNLLQIAINSYQESLNKFIVKFILSREFSESTCKLKAIQLLSLCTESSKLLEEDIFNYVMNMFSSECESVREACLNFFENLLENGNGSIFMNNHFIEDFFQQIYDASFHFKENCISFLIRLSNICTTCDFEKLVGFGLFDALFLIFESSPQDTQISIIEIVSRFIEELLSLASRNFVNHVAMYLPILETMTFSDDSFDQCFIASFMISFIKMSESVVID